MAKATPLRLADALAGVAVTSAEERMAARLCLTDMPLSRFLSKALIPHESDEVTRLILGTHGAAAFAPIAHLTVGDFRNWLLAHSTDSAVQAVRLQPNHPTDDLRGIAASMIDGLFYGAGDAVIGVNPATDSIAALTGLVHMLADVIERLQIPTQSCVLTHVTNTIQMVEQGAPVDLVFQSIAGTEATNASFGISLALLKEAREAALPLTRGKDFGDGMGDNVRYFETGQGSALSANAHHGVDQQTCEARAYGVARAFAPLLTNTVVGFIGPEYLYDGKQIIRAGLEDHFCGKLLGVPLGCDVCYTNHAEADSDDMDTLMTLLGTAGLTFIMGVPGADGIMLNYQSTSFHDALYLREVLGLQCATEFGAWLQRMHITDAGGRLLPASSQHPALAQMRQWRLGA